MKMKVSSILTITTIFILVLIPSLHVPHLSDDYFYMAIANLHDQIGHYKEWSGRIVTNIFSAYMMKYASHTVYMILNAMAFTAIAVLISSLPCAVLRGKFKLYPVGMVVIFTLMWIANPALGETSFWFVGSANYLWPSMYVSLFMVIVALQKEKMAAWKLPLALAMGFLAGCSNENTSVVLILLTIGYLIYTRKLNISYPYLIGLLTGAAVLLLSPGSAKRSLVFTDWHSLSFLGKLDLQLFTRMPDSLTGFWQVYIVIIFMVLYHAIIGIKDRKPFVAATVFFIAALMCNAAFLASPYMPARAYIGALFMLLIATSFIIFGFVENESTLAKLISPAVVILFCVVYFIPSYTFFTHSVLSTWEQEKIRMKMIDEQVSKGEKNPTIPFYYFPRLMKPTDGYPVFQNPYMSYHFNVSSITEELVGFDYAAATSCNAIPVKKKLYEGVTLESVCLYTDKISGDSRIIYKTDGNINNVFSSGNALYSHVEMSDGKVLNKDTAKQAFFIDGYWYTFSEAKDVDLSKVKEIKLGIYDAKTIKIYSNIVVNP
ncbi:DUF6056 family protein [Enterobacter bugandensis]|uniref:DUF3329 domain-containing protein n=1 Tax=Enterobacter bugandensis TaxID=881260 RepID=UPI002FD422DD